MLPTFAVMRRTGTPLPAILAVGCRFSGEARDIPDFVGTGDEVDWHAPDPGRHSCADPGRHSTPHAHCTGQTHSLDSADDDEAESAALAAPAAARRSTAAAHVARSHALAHYCRRYPHHANSGGRQSARSTSLSPVASLSFCLRPLPSPPPSRRSVFSRSVPFGESVDVKWPRCRRVERPTMRGGGESATTSRGSRARVPCDAPLVASDHNAAALCKYVCTHCQSTEEEEGAGRKEEKERERGSRSLLRRRVGAREREEPCARGKYIPLSGREQDTPTADVNSQCRAYHVRRWWTRAARAGRRSTYLLSDRSREFLVESYSNKE